MAYIEMINEADATGDLAKIFPAVKVRYTQGLGFEMPIVPDLYIVQTNAESFRSSPFGEPGYLDVLGTVGLQLGAERIANCLSVVPDDQPISG